MVGFWLELLDWGFVARYPRYEGAGGPHCPILTERTFVGLSGWLDELALSVLSPLMIPPELLLVILLKTARRLLSYGAGMAATKNRELPALRIPLLTL